MKEVVFIKKVHEYDDVYSYYFEKPQGFHYQAGQHAHVLISNFWIFGTMRELSFASAPHEEYLVFTVHSGSQSSFKKKLNNLESGQGVKLFGIHGHIALPKETDRPLVFITGGVGITPFRSMILTASQKSNYKIKLVQVQRSGEFLFRSELEPLVQEYYPVHPDNFIQAVQNLVQENPNALFYVCGSKRLIATVKKVLQENGIEKQNMYIESFK